MTGLEKNWIKFFNRTARGREHARELGPVKIVGKNGNEAWIDAIKSRLKNGMKLLDVGCGTGLHLREIYRTTDKKVEMIGIDISPQMIKIARNKSAGIKDMEFLVMDASRTKFKGGCFDVAINRLGPKSHDELFRVLKDGGYYFFFVTGKDDWKEMVNLFGFKRPHDIEFHKNGLKKAGFKIISVKKFSSIEYYKDVECLAKTLGIIPFSPIFDRKKHLDKLKGYAKKRMTRWGIKSSQKRIIITCKK